jgi:hypothetical protein
VYHSGEKEKCTRDEGKQERKKGEAKRERKPSVIFRRNRKGVKTEERIGEQR